MFTEALVFDTNSIFFFLVHVLTWIRVILHWGLHSNGCLLGSTDWIVHTDNSRLEYNDNYIVIIVCGSTRTLQSTHHTTLFSILINRSAGHRGLQVSRSKVLHVCMLSLHVCSLWSACSLFCFVFEPILNPLQLVAQAFHCIAKYMRQLNLNLKTADRLADHQNKACSLIGYSGRYNIPLSMRARSHTHIRKA